MESCRKSFFQRGKDRPNQIGMIAAMLENIVFLEMKRRGYAVYIGNEDTRYAR